MRTESHERIGLLRARCANQRTALSNELQSLNLPARGNRSPGPAVPLMLATVTVAGLVMMLKPRSRTRLRSMIATGWLAWRAVSLARTVFEARSTR